MSFVRVAVLAALLLVPATVTAQTPPYVTVSPGNMTFVGVSTVDVTIKYCYTDALGYADPKVRVNGVDVTGSASVYSIDLAPGCDAMMQADITVNLPATVEGRFTLPGNYLYNEVAYYDIPRAPRNVRVEPSTQLKVLRPSSAISVPYTVVNTGEATDTFTVSTSCTGAAVSGSCAVSPTSVVLAGGASSVVTLTGTASATVSNQAIAVVRAVASSGATVKDSTWTELNIEAAPAAGFTIVNVTDDVDRSSCVSFAAGGMASYECGDLRVVHPLPSTTRRNNTRTPALLYSSHTASPAPAISVDFTRATGSPTPDSLQICVSISGISLLQCQYSTPPAAGATRRYTRVLDGWTDPSGRYPYIVEVATVVGGVRTSQTKSGALSVVNRSGSPYGAGWWLTGIDQIIGAPGAVDTLLWIGADGSARTFGSIGTLSGVKRFVARTLDRPDTIHYNAGAGTLYRRHENDRYTTYFSTSNGYYTRTESAYGQTVDQCTSMGSDGFCSAWTMDASYVLHKSTGPLDSVVAPMAGSARRVKLVHSGGRVTSIIDPDNTAIGFSYSGSTNRIASRTDKRSAVTNYSWTNARLSSVVQDVGGFNATTTVIPAEVIGTGTGPGASLDSAYTEINGPRSDVDDRTRIWINGYGAATRVRDPQGNESRVTFDGTWKLLAQSTQNPLRLLTRAFYNARGLTDSVFVVGALGGIDTAKTRYIWNSKWRSPIRVTDPVGIKDTSAYDATYGVLLFQQRGSSSSRRVTYTYSSSGITAGLVRTVTRPPSSAVDSVFYDANGNLSRSRSAIGFVSLVYRDAAGRDTTSFAPIDSSTGRDSTSVVTHGLRSIVRYSIMGRPTTEVTIGPARTAARSITHPKDSVWLTHTYDNEGNRTATTRSYRPTPSTTASLYSSWVWDKLGRMTVENSPSSSSASFTYDLAGNLTRKTTARGFYLDTQYDALGRPTRRTTPQTTYSSRHCSTLPAQHPSCAYSFPTVGSSACIPADTARYRYNAAGHMVQADNRWARIRRDYTPAGLLVADTLRTRAWWVASNAPCETPVPEGITAIAEAAAFTMHVYGLGYSYDLAGRQTRLYHPNSIDPCGGRCEQKYGYHNVTGTLDTVIDFASRVHRFTYDDGGRVTARNAPGSVTDARTYDLDDRLIRRTISGVVADTLSLDAQGRPDTIRSGYPFAYESHLWYNGLGAVVASDNLIQQVSAEDFTVDGLGNRQRTARPNSRDFGHKDINRVRRFTYDAGGRLEGTVDSLPSPGDDSFYSYTRAQTFDASGNVQSRDEYEFDFVESFVRNDHLYSYYSADDKLTIANRHLGISTVSDDVTVGKRGVFETFRYDALGRRVGTYSQRGSACVQDHTECFPFWERTVWDGDQLLYEIRTPSHTTDTPSGGTYNAYGRVVYLHGGGIDTPLAVTRLGLNGHPAEVTTAPHADWQGDYVNGTLMSGTVQSTCTGTSGCPVVTWPGGQQTTDGLLLSDYPATTGWWGSLMQGQADASGLRYQRNRFYDPSTGQFTQQDPIGLAGGRNLYGFAGGDPVNFRDPFGLCVPFPACALAAGRAGAGVGTLVGAGVGALGAGAGAIPGALIGNRVGWVVGAGTATVGAIYLAGRHRQGVDRVGTSLGIAGEHMDRVAGMPPDDDDPQFVRDMIDHAQKHLNNAKKYVENVTGKTRRELDRQIGDMQSRVDAARQSVPPQ